jgi:hypothetical protein
LAKKEEEEKTRNVTVLSRREISVFPKLGVEVRQVMTTYVAAGLPPATVTIDKDKYNLEAEKRLIKADIERRLREKPEVFRV